MIQPGDKVPAVPVKLVDETETVDTTADAVLGRGKVVFFTIPGAFTPTCDTSHLPGFLATAGKLRERGVTRIVCGTVNDHHVVRAWAERSEALGKVDFIADVHCALADALGLTTETANLGKRFRRCAMIIADGVVQDVFVQDVAGVTVSGAPAVLLALEASTSSVSA